MIIIEFGNPDKLASNILIKKCAYVSFDYRSDILEYLQGLGCRVYHPDLKCWEVPIDSVPKFVKTFRSIDIEISGVYHDLSEDIEDVAIDTSKFKTKPYAHQIEAVKFGISKKHYMLSDGMGMGKTKEMIDTATALGSKVNKVLIICGVNSLKYNWESEVHTHSYEDAYVLGTRYRKNGNRYEGTAQDKLDDLDNLPDCKFIITNIETLRASYKKEGKNNYKFPVVDKINKLIDNGVISMILADEAHKMKNPTSIQCMAFLKLNAEYMISATGTPLMNNPLDLFVQLKWLGYTNDSYYYFQKRYCNFGGYGGHEIVGFKNMDELRSTVDSIMLRRLKEDTLDLPPKIHKTEYVEMDNKQGKLYNEVKTATRKESHKIKFSSNPLAMMTRLRQVTASPNIVSTENIKSAKMDRLKDLVDDITSAGEKVIVFSNWSEVTSDIYKSLATYKPEYITGETETVKRMEAVNKFQNDADTNVIIGTIGAMGTGLTLTSASYVIFVDEPWNMALKSQAEDRAYRIGTNKSVTIIDLITKNTIDERIHDLVIKKGQMSDALIDGKLSSEDIDYLLN